MEYNNVSNSFSINELEEETLSFVDCFANIMGVPFDSSRIVVEFSDEIKKDLMVKKGIISYSDVMWKLIKMYPDAEDRIVEIFEHHKKDDNIDGLLGHLADSIVSNYTQEGMDYSFDDSLRKLRKLFGEHPIPLGARGAIVLGEYVHSDDEPRVILYSKAIENSCITGNCMDTYRQVFVHELFHAYHYQYVAFLKGNDIFQRNDYTSSIVKESLASYFEKQFCDKENMPNRIAESWDNFDVVDYPYSGARYIDSKDAFYGLIKESVFDMDRALRRLLPPEDFYTVKNQSKKTLNKKGKSKKKPRIKLGYNAGYQSFLPEDSIEKLYIKNQKMDITRGDGFRFPERVETKTISDADYEEMISIFEAYYDDLCPDDTNVVWTNHGPLSLFSYEYKKRSAKNAGSIFTNPDAMKKIERILDRYGVKILLGYTR